MAARGRRSRAASRRGGGSGTALTWFAAGLVIGLGLAVFLFYRGYLPAPPATGQEPAEPATAAEPELLPGDSGIASDKHKPRYDFFTVLPEMEVVVPDRELSKSAQPQAPQATPSGNDQFILQVGSFRSAEEAEQMKARLALQGSVATIQKVTVNDETWHRVRIGPVQGAREADELRRRLQAANFDVLVLKVSG